MNYGKRSTTRRLHSTDAKSTKRLKHVNIIICKILLVCIVVGGIIVGSAGLGIYKGIIDSSPDMSRYDVVPTGYSTTVLDTAGNQTATLVASGANRKYATMDQIPLHVQHAFVAIEDARFYEHNGIDPYGILRAFTKGLANGLHFNQGASTITQQLIKNNVLTSWTGESTQIERFQRKIQEQYLAVQLEKQVKDKNWILENYLNSINLGNNTLGVQAASLRYFGKEVSELSLSEGAVIAGITKNPYSYNPISFPEENDKRRKDVLKKMLEQKYITQSEYDEAINDDVYSRIAEYNVTASGTNNSYFVDALIDQLEEDLTDLGYTESEAYKLIYQGGLTIESTQDSAIQAIVDEEVNNEENYSFNYYSFFLYFQIKQPDGTFNSYTETSMVRYYQQHNSNYNINYRDQETALEEIHQYEAEMCAEQGGTLVEGSESITFTLQPQLAVTLMDQSNGYVRALCGGRGSKETDRGWNRATKTTRQPGSCFKIIGCYAAAIDAGGKTLASVQDDAPFTVGTKEFNNWDFVYHGWHSIRDAIIDSTNITTVKNLQDIGVELAYQYASNLGINTLCSDDKNLALALGGITYGVKNIELTSAYATIANGGTYHEPILYTKVYDHDGNVLLDRTETQEIREGVLKDTTCFLLTDAMQDVVRIGPGCTIAHFDSEMPQAGKSGTTSNARDSLWVGFTPYYTCGLWGGFDDNAIQNWDLAGYPKVIWKKIMSRVHADLPIASFPKPAEGIVEAEICTESGLLAVPGLCDQDPRGSCIRKEYFAEDNVPTETCNHHVKLRICNDSGMIANNYCPSASITEKVYIVGSSPESNDKDVLATEEFLAKKCDKHNASTQKEATKAEQENLNQKKEEQENLDKEADKDKDKDKDKETEPEKQEQESGRSTSEDPTAGNSISTPSAFPRMPRDNH